MKLFNENCKIFRDENEMNPSNFDIYVNPNDVPANIRLEKSSQLQRRLQKLMPASKKIHFHYIREPEKLPAGNNIVLSTKLRINNRAVNLI